MSSSFSVFLGLDVGKEDHHAVGLDPDGNQLHDAPLPNTEPKLRALFDKLAQHGPLLVVVDQPATIGALPATVARAAGHQVAYPGWPCAASLTSTPAAPNRRPGRVRHRRRSTLPAPHTPAR